MQNNIDIHNADLINYQYSILLKPILLNLLNQIFFNDVINNHYTHFTIDNIYLIFKQNAIRR
jgi:hypothetical protein